MTSRSVYVGVEDETPSVWDYRLFGPTFFPIPTSEGPDICKVCKYMKEETSDQDIEVEDLSEVVNVFVIKDGRYKPKLNAKWSNISSSQI